MAYGKGGSGAVGAIRDFSSLLIGQDPFATEKIWETLFKKTFWGQGGGTVIFTAISALDIALWDIKGKHSEFPSISCWEGKRIPRCGHTHRSCNWAGDQNDTRGEKQKTMWQKHSMPWTMDMML